MRLAVVAVLWACRASPVTPDTAPLAAPSSELPAWFGEVGTRTISGTLVDEAQRPLAGTVHLRLDVPDATIWTGIDRETGTDGRFSFTAPRAGGYKVLATAPGVTSRVVDIDARTADVDVTVFAFACKLQWNTVQSGGMGITNARVDIGGTIVAHTDVGGMYSVCVTGRPLLAAIHASGYAARTTKLAEESAPPLPVVLSRAIAIRGTVLDADGHPTANIGVQPEFVDQVGMSHGSPYTDIPVNVTSDAQGRFVLREIAEMDRFANVVAAYTARTIASHEIAVHSGAWIGAHADGELVLRRDPRWDDDEISELRAEMNAELVTWNLHGRVVRGGRPVADATIMRTEINFRPRVLGFTRADGTFDVQIHDFKDRAKTARLKVQDATGTTVTAIGREGSEIVIELPSLSGSAR